jgi:hypothetical protein
LACAFRWVAASKPKGCIDLSHLAIDAALLTKGSAA